MSTNFYFIRGGAHIGKRSAAGLYCWDCDVTLHRDGNAQIHRGRCRDDRGSTWWSACPKCGNHPLVDENPPVMVELGFAKPRASRPTGVRGCSSFNWAEPPEAAGMRLRHGAKKTIVRDEYGTRYTGQEMLDMLEANCPVQFTHSVGQEFS